MIDQKNLDAILDATERRRAERRRFLQLAGGASVAAGGLALLSACGGNDDDDTPSPTPSPTPTPTGTSTTNPDGDLLNFLLQFEYLQAQYYSFAATGVGLPDTLLSGTGTLGAVTGGALVPFSDPLVAACARELAADERAHVAYLRAQLAAVAVAQPAINISGAADGPFTTLMRNAGVIGAGAVFNPYANDNSFLLGAYVFADVAVSAYKGGVPLIVSPTIASAAAGILGAEGYHAGLIRTLLYTRGSDPATGLRDAANKISDERDRLDGTTDIDQGITQADGAANIVPADGNGIAYSRSAAQVLNILYLNKASVNSGGFFPAGLNGNLKTSAAS